MPTVDLTVSSTTTSTTGDITEPSTDPFNSIDLVDVKEYLEAHYGEEEEKRRKRRLKRKLTEFIEAQDVPYDDVTTEDYPVKNEEKRDVGTYQSRSWRKSNWKAFN